MRFLIINQHTKNFGDDLAGMSLINNIFEKYPESKIDLIYNTQGLLPINDKRVAHNREITFKNIGFFSILKYLLFGKKSIQNNIIFKKMINIIDNSDYIFVSPCGANMGIYKDWQFLLRLIIVTKEKKTPIFHLNTIGKSNSLLFNILSKKVLKKSIIFVREKKSQEYLNSINIHSEFGPDTAFSYKIDKINKENKITFIPTQLSYWHPLFKNYDFDSITKNDVIKIIAKFSNEKNIPIHLLPHLNSEKELAFYELLKEEFKKYNVDVLIDKISSADDYIKTIGSSRFIIGMRYHSIVSAIKNSVPFISLSYENKMIEVCNYSKMSGYSINLFNHNYSNKLFSKLLNNLYNNEKKIIEELKYISKELSEESKIPLNEIGKE